MASDVIIEGNTINTLNPLKVALVSGGLNLGQVSLLPEEVIDDSDKSFVVPVGTEYQIISIWIELTTTATVGNRQMAIELQDAAADVIGKFLAGAVQAATLSRQYMFAPGVTNMAAFSGTYLSTQIPDIVLPAGFIIRVYDNAAIDAAADDMIVQMLVASRLV